MDFEELLKHVGHQAECEYSHGFGAEPAAIAIRCNTCTLKAVREKKRPCRVFLADATELEKSRFDKLARHADCKNIVVVCYGGHVKGQPAANVAIECEDCDEVIVDYARPDRHARSKKEDAGK